MNCDGLWSKKNLIGLGLGQFVSLLITSTGFSSSELSRRGINAPTSQSLLNYLLLAFFYGGFLVYRRKPLQMNWYYYLLLSFIDVEANYLVVKAYQYTSLTSVMLLDCWSIPSVIFLTWLFLKTKYRYRKFAGVAVCVAGLVLVVFSDVHASDRGGGSSPLKGDMLVIAGSMLYAISNVSEEFLVKKGDRIELMAMLGLFGAVVSACQIGIFEGNELRSIHWTAGAREMLQKDLQKGPRRVDEASKLGRRLDQLARSSGIEAPAESEDQYDQHVLVIPFVGFALAMFLFYSTVPIILKISGSTMLNLSLLTSDMWAVLIRIFAYHEKVDWMYFIAFGAVAVGLVVYSGGDKIEDENTNQLEEVDKARDEEAAFDNLVSGSAAGNTSLSTEDGKPQSSTPTVMTK